MTFLPTQIVHYHKLHISGVNNFTPRALAVFSMAGLPQFPNVRKWQCAPKARIISGGGSTRIVVD